MRLERKPPVVTGEPGNWQIDEEALAGLFDEADRNSKYIEAHFDELLQQYPDRWIGVFQGQVVANSKSSRGMVEKAEGNGLPEERGSNPVHGHEPASLDNLADMGNRRLLPVKSRRFGGPFCPGLM